MPAPTAEQQGRDVKSELAALLAGLLRRDPKRDYSVLTPVVEGDKLTMIAKHRHASKTIRITMEEV